VHPWFGELVVDGAASEPVAILVNGPSSSGKSTLCRALHERLIDAAGDDATFASVAFDDVVLLISDTLFPISFVALAGGDITRLVSREPHDGRAAWEYVDESTTAGGGDGHPRVRLVLRNDTRRLLSGIHRGWGEHLALGTNLIIDHFLQERDWSDEALDVIEKSGARIFSVGVYCSVQELERREASRADGELEGRPLGLARRSNELCHSHGLEYDVTVWTDQQTTEESVDAIVAALYSLQNGAPRPEGNS
jgi:chloramphenicol 3-O phosphotransferase